MMSRTEVPGEGQVGWGALFSHSRTHTHTFIHTHSVTVFLFLHTCSFLYLYSCLFSFPFYHCSLSLAITPFFFLAMHECVFCAYIWACMCARMPIHERVNEHYVGVASHIMGLLTAPLPHGGHMKRPFPGHSFRAIPSERASAWYGLLKDRSHGNNIHTAAGMLEGRASHSHLYLPF